MAKSNTEKINIVSITYRIGDQEFTATPIEKKRTRRTIAEAPSVLGQCTPGDKRCRDGVAQRCFDIGDGQSVWMTTDEPC